MEEPQRRDSTDRTERHAVKVSIQTTMTEVDDRIMYLQTKSYERIHLSMCSEM